MLIYIELLVFSDILLYVKVFFILSSFKYNLLVDLILCYLVIINLIFF